ncbi:MAG: Macrolide export ATP-binding/permease protein MacB [Parcubacteria group bacterium Athens0714_25]|nr:MAG: Macrolide export ATP-binding/permease protein MacB [Parcubacteria group bacterium Athens0714_25]
MREILTSIRLAIRNLHSNIGRTILSLTGIVIGVAAVIIVLSLGAGLKNFVVGQIEAFGSDIIEVEVKVPNVSKTSTQNAGGIAGGMQITTLKIEDAEEISKLGNIGSWYAGMMGQQLISYEGINKQAIIFGTTAGVLDSDEKMEIESGVMFSQEDDDNLKQVVVLGSEVKNTFFGEEDAVGKTVRIKNQSYRVVGVLKERGLVGFFNFDDVIYMPIQTLQKKLMGIDYIQFAIFKLKDASATDVTVSDVTAIMRDQHDITDPSDDDFAVSSIEEFKVILDKVFLIINILLLALTSISLIVGGVGIMNVMYVSITERTAEIGLRKAVGAKKSDILKQFLFESIFLTLFGGIIGVVLGLLVSWLATYVVGQYGYSVEFQIGMDAILIAGIFSLVTGILFGMYPARRGSELSPMEALRKE